MKKLIVLLSTVLMLGTSTGLFSQQNIQSKIDKAIVFSQGAQIERTQKVKLKQGENIISFINVETAIKSQTIQVYGSDKITIVSTDFKRKTRENKYLPKNIVRIKDSIKALDRKISLKRSEKSNYTNEKNMILTNKSVGGNQGFDIEDLMDLSDYYRTKLNEIDELVYKNGIEVNELMKTKAELNKELSQNGFSGNMGVIEVKIIANAPVTANLKLTYIVNNASWTPFYDIKSKGIDNPLEMVLKATINQNTGVNWNGVELVLSTSTPLNYGVIPEVHPWVLRFKSEYKQKNMQKRSYSNAYQVQSNASYDMSAQGKLESSVSLADFTKTTENMTNREFNVSLPYTIKGVGGKAIVELDKYSMKSDYVYYTAPKFDKNVYLLAHVDEWEQYNLLPGTANIFLQGTFVGNSFINPNDVSDTLSLLLGKDQDVVVDRKKIKDYGKKAVLGSTKTTELGIEVLVKNKKNKNVSIIVEDQVPISKTEEIEVKVLDKSKAKHEVATGKLTWKYTLKAGESKKHIIRYEVKHPKKKTLGNL